jgi:hypothetical protein
MPSSVIRSWHYDAQSRALDVLFVSGKRYSYSGVPAEIVEGLHAASSKGSYFNQVIRDHFPYTRGRAVHSLA